MKNPKKKRNRLGLSLLLHAGIPEKRRLEQKKKEGEGRVFYSPLEPLGEKSN